MASIIYELNVLKGYLEQYLEDDALILILGNHQPNVQIAGNNRSWSVPIHVLSRNRDFLKPFAARGYTAGIIPRQPPRMTAWRPFFITSSKTSAQLPPKSRWFSLGSRRNQGLRARSQLKSP